MGGFVMVAFSATLGGRSGAQGQFAPSWTNFTRRSGPCPDDSPPTPEARWTALTEMRLRYRGAFADIDGVLPDGEAPSLCRLGYVGSAHSWLRDSCAEPRRLPRTSSPTGRPVGSAEDAPGGGLLPHRPHA
jgi:hypothetical protein